MRHATSVLRVIEGGKTTFVGTCTCGFVGPDRDNDTAARSDVNRHAIDAMRGKTKEK